MAVRFTTVELKENGGGHTNAPGVLAGDRIVQVLDTSDWSDVTSLFAKFAAEDNFVVQNGDYGGTADTKALVLLDR